MPLIAIAAVNECYGMKNDRRIVLNPFENTPSMLEILRFKCRQSLQLYRNLLYRRYIPQTGEDGDATLAKADATKITEAMRKQARSILAKLLASPGRRVIMVYDGEDRRSISCDLRLTRTRSFT
jgi:hypothetical protein